MRETADAVVIGGGTTGCAIAWHLARAGVAVRLLERTAIGAGSSGASPGIVRQYYADPMLVTLASCGLAMYRRWHEELGGDCLYRQTSFLTAITSADAVQVRAHVARLREAGIALEWYSPDDVLKLGADITVEGLAGAVYEPDAGYCDARATARAFAEAAGALGATIEEGCAVRRVRRDNGRVIGVDTERGQIDCGVVFNAAGPWAATLAATCDAALPIVASRQSIAIVRVNEPAPLPGYAERGGGFYLRPDLQKRYVIGSLRANDSGPIDPDDGTQFMSATDGSRYRDRVARRFIRFADAELVDSRVSFFDDTPDGNPLFGPDPRISRMFVAAGLSGHGFKFAPVFGQAAADWLLNGQMRPELDRFDVARVLC